MSRWLNVQIAIALSVTFTLVSFSGYLYSQNTYGISFVRHTKSLERIRKNYDANDYGDKVIEYIFDCLSKNDTFEPAALEAMLSSYKDFAYRKTTDGYYRIYYYRMLTENARLNKRYGEALYYSEMADREILAYGDPFAYTASIYKAIFYNNSGQYQKTAVEYQKGYNSADRVLSYRNKKKLTSVVYNELMELMKFTMLAYVHLGDTVNAKKILDQSIFISNLKSVKYAASKRNSIGIQGALLEIKFDYFLMLLKNKEMSRKIIADYDSYAESAVKTELIDKGVYVMGADMKLRYFSVFVNLDSLNYYVDRFKKISIANGYDLDQSDYLEPEYQAYNDRHDYEKANNVGKSLISFYKDALGQSLSSQLDLMYTDIQSRKDKMHIAGLEREKQKTKILIWSLLLASVLILVIIVMRMQNNKKRSQKAITQLQYISRAQIEKQREENETAIVEEREKLGRDLHDGMSGTLASIQHRLNAIRMEQKDGVSADEMDLIGNMLTEVYESVRNKSHELFKYRKIFLNRKFEDRIKAVMDTALPVNRYKAELVLDGEAAASVKLDYREHIIYILMECLTNIIKYARATEVSVMLTKNEHFLFLQVSDNGRGLRKSLLNNDSIGLQSIEKRAALINGKVALYTDEGTTVVVKFV